MSPHPVPFYPPFRSGYTVGASDPVVKALIFLFFIFAALFFGVPYYSAYKRRQKLKEHEERSGKKRDIFDV